VLLVALAATHLPLFAGRVAVYLLCWFQLVVVVGQAVHARRDELAAATFFPRPPDPADTPERLAAARERAADEVYALWRNGAKEEAWLAAERYARGARHPAEEWYWLSRRVGHWDARPLEERIKAALQRELRPPMS
jgi:hypothetical protein